MTDLAVLIIDDEPLARRRLARMIAPINGLKLVGEAEDIAGAEMQVLALRPDLLLLDVQLPGGSGFDLLDRLGEATPVVIFVTAFDHHALRAFDASAADYVTKPVDPGRLVAAIGRAMKVAQARRTEERLAELTETVAALRTALHVQDTSAADLWIKVKGGHVRVPVSQIVSIQAERDYVRVFVDGGSYLMHESLASLEARLDERDFLRVHRSAIVRRNHVVRLRNAPFAALIAVLDDGSEVRVGRTYAKRIREIL